MSADKIRNAVLRWNELVCDIETALDNLRDTVGLNPEAPLPTAAWALAGGYMDALDVAYGIGGWLEWWWHECRLGENPMQAGFDGKVRLVATIEDLIGIILEDLART